MKTTWLETAGYIVDALPGRQRGIGLSVSGGGVQIRQWGTATADPLPLAWVPYQLQPNDRIELRQQPNPLGGGWQMKWVVRVNDEPILTYFGPPMPRLPRWLSRLLVWLQRFQ